LEIQSYWSVIRRRLWLIALITIVCCAAVGYYSYRMAVPQYEASAKLIVNQHSAQSKQDAILDAGSINSDIMLIKTYKEIIRTPRILEKVVQQYPDLHASVSELGAKIGVSSVNETQVMSISATDADPARAARMANAVSNVFQQEIPKLMNVDNVHILNWADPQADRSPISPQPTRNIAIAFVLSAMAGIGLAFLIDKLNDAVRTGQDIEDGLELPLLAEIPRIKTRGWTASDKQETISAPAGRKKNATFDA